MGYARGSIELRVPRVRDGGYYPALLEPRRRGERALVAVGQEAYVNGVSTRRVDDLVKALGINGVSKSQVSRLCQALDTEVERFLMRRARRDVRVHPIGRNIRQSQAGPSRRQH